MYILPRIIGIGTYMTALVLFLLVVRRIPSSHRKMALFLYGVALFIMAFFYVPPEGQDLFRLFNRMEYYTSMSWSKFRGHLITGGEPLTNIYYRIIGKTGIKGLLPGVTSVIVFYFCFKILNKSARLNGTDNASFEVALFLLMARGFFGTAISNIRTLIAVSLACYGFFNEFYLNKPFYKALAYYIVASLFHVMGILLLVLRIAYFAVENVKSINKKIRNCLLLIAAAAIMFIFSGRFINTLMSKASSYFAASQNGSDFFYIWEFILTILQCLLTAYLIIKYKRQARSSAFLVYVSGSRVLVDAGRLVNFISFLLAVEVVFMFVEYSVFFRTAFVFSILCVPVYISLIAMKSYSIGNRNINAVRNNLVIISIIILVLEAARGNLCSLKFFE